jgi:hypothetical protein
VRRHGAPPDLQRPCRLICMQILIRRARCKDGFPKHEALCLYVDYGGRQTLATTFTIEKLLFNNPRVSFLSLNGEQRQAGTQPI